MRSHGRRRFIAQQGLFQKHPDPARKAALQSMHAFIPLSDLRKPSRTIIFREEGALSNMHLVQDVAAALINEIWWKEKFFSQDEY